MSTLAEMTGMPMPYATRFARIAPQDRNPYTRGPRSEDRRLPRVEFRGFLSSSSSTRTPGQSGAETTSQAVLTVPDPGLDLRNGDVVEPVPADGRRWTVDGFPSADTSPFTGWQPTLEARLTEVRGGENGG